MQHLLGPEHSSEPEMPRQVDSSEERLRAVGRGALARVARRGHDSEGPRCLFALRRLLGIEKAADTSLADWIQIGRACRAFRKDLGTARMKATSAGRSREVGG